MSKFLLICVAICFISLTVVRGFLVPHSAPYESTVSKHGMRLNAKSNSDPFAMFSKIVQDKMTDFAKFSGSTSIKKSGKSKIGEYDADILKATILLENAADTKKEAPDAVVGALLDLEKLMRAKNKADDNATSQSTLDNLDGSWRLIFTTGTVDTQKKIGQINYFPIKAVQSFNTRSMTLTNGIYVNDFALLKFFGPFEWKLKARKLEFDFDEIAVLGLKFRLPKGGAAKIGQQTGLGSENNVELVKKGAQPFFNWILASDRIAVARGGGGGLALWKRDLEMQNLEAAASP